MKIVDILIVLAIVSVLTLCIVIYQKPVSYDQRCYNPETKFNEDATDCVYNEDEGIWTCNERKYKYCL